MTLFQSYCKSGLLLLICCIPYQKNANAALRIPKTHKSKIALSSGAPISDPPKLINTGAIRTFFVDHFTSEKDKHPHNKQEHKHSRAYHEVNRPGYGVLAFCLGLVGLAFVFINGSLFGLLFSIGAFVLGIIGLKYTMRGMAMIGILCGLVGIILEIVLLIILMG